MDKFVAVFLEMFRMVVQKPPTQEQMVVVGVASLAAGAWVFLKVCDKFDLPNVGMITAFLYSILGGAVMLAAMAAGNIWLTEWRKPLGDAVFNGVLALLAAVAVFAPILNAHIKGKYMGTVSAWLLAVVTALAVCSLGNNLFDLGKMGQRALNRGAEHNATTRDAIR